MAIVQSTKTAGNITVEATSPGLAPASVTIAAKGVTLRPQVALWNREVPAGSGITGLWRPVPSTAGDSGILALLRGAGSSVFTLRQDGSSLTGTVEGTAAGSLAAPMCRSRSRTARSMATQVSFKAGNNTYTGTLKGEQIELQQTTAGGFPRPTPAKEEAGRPVSWPAARRIRSVNQSIAIPAESPNCLRRAQR